MSQMPSTLKQLFPNHELDEVHYSKNLLQIQATLNLAPEQLVLNSISHPTVAENPTLCFYTCFIKYLDHIHFLQVLMLEISF